jgi:hypothetical protein
MGRGVFVAGLGLDSAPQGGRRLEQLTIDKTEMSTQQRDLACCCVLLASKLRESAPAPAAVDAVPMH